MSYTSATLPYYYPWTSEMQLRCWAMDRAVSAFVAGQITHEMLSGFADGLLRYAKDEKLDKA